MNGGAPAHGEERSARPGRDDRLYELAGRLTERDRLCCRLLVDHRVLTTGQLADVAFPSVRKAQARLALLYRFEVLDRFRLRSWSGSGPFHWILGSAGAAVIAAERGVSVIDLGWHRDIGAALATNRQLGHLVGANGVLTGLLRAARTQPGSALAEWWSPRRCAAAWADAIRPDAYAVWVEDGVRLPFCFEYDTGSETLSRLAGKLDGYATLARAAGHPTWVLFASRSSGREAAARRVLGHPEVPVATAVVAGQTVDGPCWLPVADTGTGVSNGTGRRLRLINLGHPSRALVRPSTR